jgi:uncharacterized protein (TIGR03435 family)
MIIGKRGHSVALEIDLQPMKDIMIRRMAALLASLSFAGATALGQSPSAEKGSTFEVASIRQNTSGGMQYTVRPTRAGFIATNMPLTFLIHLAYGLEGYQLVGAPAWATDRYDVTAKPAGATGKEMRAMLQNLLADRFQLKVHKETRVGTEYALMVAKGGSKLKAPGEASCPAENGPSANPCGRLSWGQSALAGRRVDMQALVIVLAQKLGHKVVDETGLKGPFDLSLRWTPEGAVASPPPVDAPPSLLTALEEQMGLRLQTRKGPTEVVVVDHVERPSEN